MCIEFLWLEFKIDWSFNVYRGWSEFYDDIEFRILSFAELIVIWMWIRWDCDS